MPALLFLGNLWKNCQQRGSRNHPPSSSIYKVVSAPGCGLALRGRPSCWASQRRRRDDTAGGRAGRRRKKRGSGPRLPGAHGGGARRGRHAALPAAAGAAQGGRGAARPGGAGLGRRHGGRRLPAGQRARLGARTGSPRWLAGSRARRAELKRGPSGCNWKHRPASGAWRFGVPGLET